MYDPKRGYPRIVPFVLYPDPGRALTWLREVLAMREVLRYTAPDGSVPHAELRLGEQILMIGQAGHEYGNVDSITLVFVEDVHATCALATARGGTVWMEPADKPWGLRQAVIADPQGQRWEVSQHLRDAPADEWGAVQVAPMPG